MTPARGVTTIHGEDIASLVLSRPASESEPEPSIVVTPLAGVMEVERRHFLQKKDAHPRLSYLLYILNLLLYTFSASRPKSFFYIQQEVDNMAPSSSQPERAENKPFDVFLCHNSNDKPEVKEIARQLYAEELNPWLDEWQLPPGQPWLPLLEQ